MASNIIHLYVGTFIIFSQIFSGNVIEKHNYAFGTTSVENRNNIMSPTSALNTTIRQITSTASNTSNPITLQPNIGQLDTNQMQLNQMQPLRGWQQQNSLHQPITNVGQFKQEQIDTPKRPADGMFSENVSGGDNSSVRMMLNAVQPIGNDMANINQSKKKKSDQRILEEHEKQQIVEEMTNNKLGEMCLVCYKIFRNKDALEFHIMNTKMLGHEELVKQRVKNLSSNQTTARTSEQPSLATPMISLDETSLDLINGIFNVDPAKMVTDRGIDTPKTSEMSYVKQEPPIELDQTSKVNTQSHPLSSLEGTQHTNILPENAKHTTEKVEPHQASVSCLLEKKLMPPPTATSASKTSKKPSSSKIFNCFECNRGFKKEMKLIKHVMRKHSGKSNPDKEAIDQKESTLNTDVENTTNMSAETFDGVFSKPQFNDKKGQEIETASLKFSPMGCPDCVMLFTTKDEMMLHFSKPPHRLMCNLNVNKCPVLTCDVSFSTKSKLLEHLEAGKHGQACPQCGKDFPKVISF